MSSIDKNDGGLYDNRIEQIISIKESYVSKKMIIPYNTRVCKPTKTMKLVNFGSNT